MFTNLESIEPGKTIAWPFYVLCDVSKSMWREDEHGDYSPWHAIADGLAGLTMEVDQHPAARDICHLSVLAFGERVETVLPLTPLSDPNLRFSGLPRQTLTDYGVLFRHLVDVVDRDFKALEAANYSVKRPTLYFMTDGRAEDAKGLQSDSAWHPSVRRLHALPSKPIVISLGLGTATESSLLTIASPPGPACVAKDNALPSDLLGSIIHQIIRSIVLSSEGEGFRFDLPPGMRRLDG